MAAISSFLSPNLYHNPRECSGFPKTAAWLVAGASPASYRSLSSFSLSSSASCSVRRRRTFSISAVDSTATAEPEAARRLYVGNIPRTVNNEELTKMFAEHGSVAKAEVMYDKYSGRSRRFAFVTMNSAEDANAAIEKLNDTVLGAKVSRVPGTSKSSGFGFVSFSSDEEVEAAIASFNNAVSCATTCS
ncbi:hypothetical protein B296_00012690 [Ensete ventricosum]|uniref:RRM domain-containing protein n=1 Tax=Ensete ventricosum TaxID=4639 RepID=A0A427A2I3_ENSVE|nr:hypothetical protein B296_00012690 [Ensete ventricosum]